MIIFLLLSNLFSFYSFRVRQLWLSAIVGVTVGMVGWQMYLWQSFHHCELEWSPIREPVAAAVAYS